MKRNIIYIAILFLLAVKSLSSPFTVYASYTSQYPNQDADHVKATYTLTTDFLPHYTTNPAKSLTGGWTSNQWLTDSGHTQTRFHIDLGSGFVIKRIYYQNAHTSGSNTEYGAKNFTVWGSNDDTAFATLTYGTDTNWTQITTDISQFVQHTASDTSDPQYVVLTNSTSYRYYAIKIVDSWGGGFTGLRRIELQTEDATATPTPTPTSTPTPTPTGAPTPTPTPTPPGWEPYSLGLTGACSLKLIDRLVVGGSGTNTYRVTNEDDTAYLSKIKVYWDTDPDPDDHQTYQCFEPWGFSSDYPERGHFFCSAGDVEEYIAYGDSVMFEVAGEPIQPSISLMKVACYFNGSETPATNAVIMDGDSITNQQISTASGILTLTGLPSYCDDIKLTIPIVGEFRIPNYVCEVQKFIRALLTIDLNFYDEKYNNFLATLNTRVPFGYINALTPDFTEIGSPSGVANIEPVHLHLDVPSVNTVTHEVTYTELIDGDFSLAQFSDLQEQITQGRTAISVFLLIIASIAIIQIAETL